MAYLNVCIKLSEGRISTLSAFYENFEPFLGHEELEDNPCVYIVCGILEYSVVQNLLATNKHGKIRLLQETATFLKHYI